MSCIRFKAAGSGQHLLRAEIREVKDELTDWLRLKKAGTAALALAFPVDGGHLDLVGRLWFQSVDDHAGHVCLKDAEVIH